MAQRSEKKGIPQELIKNREQVRHYYYRTWHKIANSLEISDGKLFRLLQEVKQFLKQNVLFISC